MADKTLSQRHEREFSQLIPNGNMVPASGAGIEKRDVKQEEGGWFRHLYELKCTQQKGYRLTAKDWQALVTDVYTRSPNMRPGWAIRFYGDDAYSPGNVRVIADLVVLDLNDHVEMLEELLSLREKVDSLGS